jgi:lytic murein transglycosylase
VPGSSLHHGTGGASLKSGTVRRRNYARNRITVEVGLARGGPNGVDNPVGTGMKRLGEALLAMVLLCAGLAAPAAAQSSFAAFVEALWPEARTFGVSRATFDAAFKGVEPDLSLPDLVLPGRTEATVKGQAEFTRPPQDYLDKKLLANLAAQAKGFAKQHASALDRVESELGVDRRIVLAIWGRETAFGSHKLPHYAVRVLATQAYTGRRKELFRRELLFGLKMLENGIVTIPNMRASWAGAMGLTQFMPSEFFQSAYDLDKDGKADLFNSVPDALGSAAKQLKDKGWVANLPWGFEVRLPAGLDCGFDGPANARTIAEWTRAGVATTSGRPIPANLMASSAYLMSPGGAYGPSFLVTDNFKVLRAYNTSDLYAVFVGHLADRIGGTNDFDTPWKPITQLPNRDVEEIQKLLKAAGSPIDKIDGKIGSNTRWLIGTYQRKAGIAVDCWPTAGLLSALRAGTVR